jgi:signal transduction histidine kinase
MKLSLKLTLALVVAVAVVLAAFGVGRVERELTLFQTDMSADHRAFGRALASAVMEVARREGDERALELVQRANLREGGVDIRWVPEPTARTVSRVEETPSGRYLVTNVRLELPPPHSGSIQLTESMGDEDQYVDDTIRRTVLRTATTAGVCGVLILLLGWIFVGRPMNRLMDKARRVGAGDLTGPLRLRQRDEIGALAEEMNAMCDRLAEARATVAAETAARINALEQLRHADRLATVGKLASGLAHELGTPLNVVLARARMIERGESTGPQAADDARIIAEQTDRMTAIIRQLLDFARRRSVQREPTDLSALARRTLSLIEPIATKRGIVLDGPSGESPVVDVDGSQMEQVLTNLVINAVHAQPKGGNVRIRLEHARRAPPPDLGGEERRWLSLSVEDDGVGMAKEIREHAFEPFFTTKDVGEGTGLGLSVAWGIVREHGGFIEMWSEQGRGSRFTVYLPEAESEA